MLGAVIALLLGSAPADLAAVGVVVAPSPESSVAILRSEGRTRIVSVGDRVFGGRLLAVSRDQVSLVFEGERVDLWVRSTDQPAPALPAPRFAATASPARTASEGPPAALVMNREEVQRRLGLEMNRILSETAIRPVTEDGRVVGVRLTRIAQSSLLTDAGLRAGDVLTNINGTEIDGMATLISLWPRLQGASALQASGLRDGRPFSISLTLQ
jgi:general secretion pathway protein C